jgi:hypothetical protein
MLVVSLNAGEHFAVIAREDNLEGDDFWILICEEPWLWLRSSIRLIIGG